MTRKTGPFSGGFPRRVATPTAPVPTRSKIRQSNFLPRHAGVLAALGERFPRETRSLVSVITPPLAGHALRRMRNAVCAYVSRLSAMVRSEESEIAPATFPTTTLWLSVTFHDLGRYGGLQAPELTQAAPEDSDPAAGLAGALRPRPNLGWCRLKARFIESVGLGLPRRSGAVWARVARWVRDGFPLHYRGPARESEPLRLDMLRRATRTIEPGFLPPLRAKILALLEERGPMFGPYETPPYRSGVVSPVLVVAKKSGDVRPVYHCSHPSAGGHPCERRSLNGGIKKGSFWFPVYDSVASWLLQWYFIHWVLPPLARGEDSWVIFKLDFESAFRQIPIRPRDWPLLALYDSSTDAYLLETCAAFGTRISADLWLRIANIWKVCLHAEGFPMVMVYVDDLAVICRTQDVPRLASLVITLEDQLGSRIHWGKVFSDGGCSARASVLGVTVDVAQNVLGLDPDKTRRRLRQIDDTLARQSWSTRDLESLVGALNFFATALPTGRLFLGPLYALLRAKKDFVTVGPSHTARSALTAWKRILARSLAGGCLQPLLFPREKVVWIATDASDTGLGGCSQLGAWSAGLTGGIAEESINVRELVALWISISEIWDDRLRGSLVHAFVDNETARTWAGHPPSSSIRQSSWTLVIHLQSSLASTLQRLGCTLVVHRIPTLENDVADALSRKPEILIGPRRLEVWKAALGKRVDADPGQRLATSWLSGREHETPLLWWRSKPTALSPLVPAPIREVLSPSELSPSDSFGRRPLLYSLLQVPLDEDWEHQRVDGVHVEAWWKSLGGPQDPTRL